MLGMQASANRAPKRSFGGEGKSGQGFLKKVGVQIKSALSNPWNTLSAKTLQGESPLGKHRYFSSSRSRQIQDLQSPVVRIRISQTISASVNLFIKESLVLLLILLCGGYNILFCQECQYFLYRLLLPISFPPGTEDDLKRDLHFKTWGGERADRGHG